MDLTKGYQPEKFQLSGSSFTEELQKYSDDVIINHFIFLGFEIFIFCESTYKLSSCQVSNSSVI